MKFEDVQLSVVMPVYNEERWVREVVRRVRQVPLAKELIVVDDGSTDGTRAILRELEAECPDLRLLLLPCNRGKGAALRAGFRQATGDVVVVQDADLEYDPADYPTLLQPILEGRADVVYGSRLAGGGRRGLGPGQYLANRVLTWLSNRLTGLRLTDMETGSKAFRREVLAGLALESDRFGFEPEITAKVARKRGPAWRVCEVPIRYAGRSYAEGKKIGVKDAFSALWCIVRFRYLG
ncbi:MAG TPA: glycosyltransferase family 2 protein [Gemmataceae bacterium]|nr:glycosyltransferase family 2 protein [Gemmataceae bacterium]